MAEQDNSPDTDAQAPTRKRPKPGERRVQILQTLAVMLEQPGAERITTAASERSRVVPPLRQQGSNV